MLDETELTLFIMKKILVVHAIQLEQIKLHLPGVEIKTILSGIGKAKAAMNVMQAVIEFQPDFVLNIGTAGTLNHNVGDIIVSHHFVDRDMVPLVAFGLESDLVSIVPEGWQLSSYIGGNNLSGDFIVNTGDDFVTADSGIEGDVVDMEAFAEALVCRKMNLPFLSIKYVTDVVGQNSIALWEEKLADARNSLSAFFDKNVSFPT